MAERIWTGMDELQKELRALPAQAAQRLQNAVAANHADHRREVIESSDFSPEGKRLMKFAIRIQPNPSSGRRKVDRLEDVVGETYSTWKGHYADRVEDGAARLIEKQVGEDLIRPRSARYLLIPQGDFLTPSGRPRRTRQGPGGTLASVSLKDEPDTAVIEVRGRKLLVQNLRGSDRGRFERATGTTKRTRGDRMRVIGVLVRQAKQARPLDFFGSWDRLESRRDARFDRLLDDLVR